jgi:hypothetical protein
MTPQRGIVPLAKPKPAAQTAVPKVSGTKMPPPAGFDPKKFMAAMNTYPTAWQQLPIEQKIVRVMAYMPSVTNGDAIAGAISATDEYTYRLTSPHAPMLQGVPVAKAAPTIVSPLNPETKAGVNPSVGYITDVPQNPIAGPPVGIPAPMPAAKPATAPKQIVKFDPRSGRMVSVGVKPAGQAQGAGFGFCQVMLWFGAGAFTAWLLSNKD